MAFAAMFSSLDDEKKLAATAKHVLIQSQQSLSSKVRERRIPAGRRGKINFVKNCTTWKEAMCEVNASLILCRHPRDGTRAGRLTDRSAKAIDN